MNTTTKEFLSMLIVLVIWGTLCTLWLGTYSTIVSVIGGAIIGWNWSRWYKFLVAMHNDDE